MHLTFIIHALSSGGSERVVSELANYFVEVNKYSVSLITFTNQIEQPFYSLHENINLIQLSVGNNKNGNNYSIIWRVKNIIKRILCLRNIIKSIKPDVVVSFIDINNIIALLATLKLNIPVIVSERTSLSDHNIPILYKLVRKLTYPLAKNIVVQTKSNSSYFSNNLNHKIRIIPNIIKVVEDIEKKYVCNKKVTNIVTVGRLEKCKDHYTLIKAFANLTVINPINNITLTIYGEGVERSNLEQLISSLSLQTKIFLPGAIKDVIATIAKADLFVFPSRYEGFPNALCEAMAVGLPVIASNCSGNIEIIQDGINGKLFPIGDIETLTKLMQLLINDFKTREQLSLNARKITERFHEDAIYGAWTKVIDSSC